MPESKAITRVLSSGYMLDAKAFEMIRALSDETDADSLVEKILVEKAILLGGTKVITEDDVVKFIPKEARVPIERVVASDPAAVEVLSDPTQAIAPVEGVEGFNKLFRDRYQRLFSIVRERMDTKNSTTVSAARNLAPGKKTRVAGLLADRSSRR